MKYNYRIIKKKGNDYYTIQEQEIKKKLFGIKLGSWFSCDSKKTTEECENFIIEQIKTNKEPELIVIKEYINNE